MRQTLTDRFFGELEDETPNVQSIPTLDDYGRALDYITYCAKRGTTPDKSPHLQTEQPRALTDLEIRDGWIMYGACGELGGAKLSNLSAWDGRYSIRGDDIYESGEHRGKFQQGGSDGWPKYSS